MAFAGDLVAGVGPGRRDGVLVADWRTGVVRARIPLSSDVDDVKSRDVALASTGRVVASVDGRLLTAAPGRSARRVRGSEGRNLDSPRMAGKRIVALQTIRSGAERPVVLDPRRRRIRAIGAPSTAFGPLATGASKAVWVANGCLLTAQLGERAPTRRSRGVCPRSEVTLEGGDPVLRGRSLEVYVTSGSAPRSGCRGTVILRGRREGDVVGRGRFRARPGRTRRVIATLSSRGVRTVRRMLRREAEAFLFLDARVADGRAVRSGGFGMVIEREVRRPRR